MRVLVTGNLGFIGAHFTGWLLANDPGVAVIGFNRLGNVRNLDRYVLMQTYGEQCGLGAAKDGWMAYERGGRFRQVWGDLRDRGAISGLCEGVDVVVNFAAKTFVDHSLKDVQPFIDSNILGAHNLMDDAHKHGVRRFIQVSTDEVYGQILHGKYAEDATLQPRNPYAWTKACSDLDAIWRHRTYGFPVIVTRTENNFGPWQDRQKVLPTFVRAAVTGGKLPVYGDGGHVRCWLYVEDHCRAIAHLAAHGEPGEIYHVAGEKEMTNLDLAYLVLDTLGLDRHRVQFIPDHNVRPGHDRRYALDVSKLRATGWTPKYELLERMEHTIRWYAAHPEWTQ